MRSAECQALNSSQRWLGPSRHEYQKLLVGRAGTARPTFAGGVLRGCVDSDGGRGVLLELPRPRMILAAPDLPDVDSVESAGKPTPRDPKAHSFLTPETYALTRSLVRACVHRPRRLRAGLHSVCRTGRHRDRQSSGIRRRQIVHEPAGEHCRQILRPRAGHRGRH